MFTAPISEKVNSAENVLFWVEEVGNSEGVLQGFVVDGVYLHQSVVVAAVGVPADRRRIHAALMPGDALEEERGDTVLESRFLEAERRCHVRG